MRWYKTSKWIQSIFMMVLGAFVVMPLVWVIFQSLENTVAYDVNNVFLFIRQYLSFGQYEQVMFHDYEYWAAYWNTIWLSVPTLAVAVMATTMAAYGITIIQKKIQGKILVVYAVLSLLPMQVLLVPQLILLSNMQLTGTHLAVILVGSFSPWYVFFLHWLCKGISEETFEMARVEGAGEWKVFCKIALPQMKLGIAIFAIIISSNLWGMVEEPLVYIQDISKYPLSVLFQEMGTQISYAGVVLFSFPVVVIFLEGIRNVVNGERE